MLIRGTVKSQEVAKLPVSVNYINIDHNCVTQPGIAFSNLLANNYSLVEAILSEQAKVDFKESLSDEVPVKLKVQRIADLLDYMPDRTWSMILVKRITGSVVLTSVDAGANLIGKKIPFDSYIQIVEGFADILIDTQNYLLESGDGIMVPAHSSYSFISSEIKFKMMITIIKSGYED